MEKTTWKTIAIILLLVCLVESSIIILSYNYAKHINKQNAICSSRVCIDYMGYTYDDVSETCFCYEAGELVKSETIPS